MIIRNLFEAELNKRHLPFTIDPESGRHVIEIGGGQMLVSLDNLQRDVDADGDVGRVSRFVDSIVASASASEAPRSVEQLYWCLERNDYAEPPDFRMAVSERVDRVLVHLSADERLITWATPAMLTSLGITAHQATERAFANLARSLASASLQSQDIDGVQLGYLDTPLPFKSSLILAPNLKEVVGTRIGWPLAAVAPDRGFLYLWAARHADFTPRVGSVVVNEYSRSSYPLSTEVYHITDRGVKAIGEFPVRA